MEYQFIYFDENFPRKAECPHTGKRKTVKKSFASQIKTGFVLSYITSVDKKYIYIDGLNLNPEQMCFMKNEMTRLIQMTPRASSIEESAEESPFYILVNRKVRTVPVIMPRDINISGEHERKVWNDEQDVILFNTKNVFHTGMFTKSHLSYKEIKYLQKSQAV